MSSPVASESTASTVEIKGRMATLTVLRVLSLDAERLGPDLDQLLARAQGLFDRAPVVLDGSALEQRPDPAALQVLLGLLRERAMVPVGVVGMDEAAAQAVGLTLMRGLEGSSGARRSAPPSAAPAGGGSRVVSTPVRSGQQIYARGGDLVVLAPVSAGAEVLADGHLHVYGALRGRALAGVQGDREARIFCQQLGAELLSIAGSYMVSERLPPEMMGRAVQVRLDGEHLRIEALSGLQGER